MKFVQFILISILINLTILLSAELTIISGRVFNVSTKEGIPDVNLFLPKQKLGASTSSDGTFLIHIFPDNNIILHVSHISYASKKISLNGNTENLNIALKEIFYEAEEVVVTSTRTNKIHKNVPIATEIITKKDINDSGTLNVSDLLSCRSGVSLQTSVEGGAMLNILGMDSRYILILINGQPIAGKFNNRVALDQIFTSQINKIEIIKGPSSSLYGSEAMAGVINIITEGEIKNNLLNFKARYGGSEYNIISYGLNQGYSNIQLNGEKSFEALDISLNATVENIKTDKAIQQLDIDNVNKQSFGGEITLNSFINHNFKLTELLYNHKENGSSTLMNTNTDIIRNNITISHDWSIHSNWSIRHSLQHQFYSRAYSQIRPWGDIVTDNITNENYVEYENIIYFKIGASELNFGMETSNSSYQSDRVQNDKQFISTNSIFGQYDFNIIEKLDVVLGTRLDKYSGHDLVNSPRIGLMYMPKNRWKFRATWGKGFRAPSFMERFIEWNHVQFNYKVIGNPDLKPEVSNGYTAGIEYYHPTTYQVSMMLYYNKFEDLIQDHTVEPATDTSYAILSYNNIKVAEYKGLEIHGRWSISNNWVSSWGLNVIDNRDGDGNIIPNTEPLSSYLRLSYQQPYNVWNLSLQLKWVGSFTPNQYNPDSGTYNSGDKMEDYFIIDSNVKINYFKPMILGVGIKNFGDYTNEQYGPFIGREYYLEISTTIKGK